MNLITNKSFGGLSLDIFASGDEFYMSRRQINEALQYEDQKTMNRLISRNRDAIGEGICHDVVQMEGERMIKRSIELFNFKQIFQILRFSRSPKAEAFMAFTALTMEQLLMGKAELTFHDEKDSESYATQVKGIMARAVSFGIPKLMAAKLTQEARLSDKDPEILILEEIYSMIDMSTKKRKGRIRERIDYLAKSFYDGSHEDAWHEFSAKMKYEIGIDMRRVRNDQKIARQKAVMLDQHPLPDITGYLELIEKYDAFAEAERIIMKMLKELEKDIPI